MRRGRAVTLPAALLAAAGLTACSSSTTTRASGTSPSDASPHTSVAASPSSSAARQKAIVIKTQFVDFDGTVLAGSTLGDAPFCAGGKLHHVVNRDDGGFPAINVFTCGASELRIGFGPGPDQMDNAVQTSKWEVLSGTGDFAGAKGSGQMKVVFPQPGASSGKETFTGTIEVP